MKKIIVCMVGGLFLMFLGSAWGMDGVLRNVIQNLTEKKIILWAKDPIVVNSVREANKGTIKSQEEIDRLDEEWKTIEGVDKKIERFLNNECALLLKRFQHRKIGKRTLYSEIFIMDRQGLIVAETDKTSDYWQGDEDKFIKSFNEGEGSIFIDEPTFDISTKTYSVQVSVPIFDLDTKKTIGAMTVGIDLDALTEYVLDL